MASAGIVSSVIGSQVVQVDGRISVDEFHTDNTGAITHYGYLAAATDNLSTNLAAHATALAAALNAGEIAANVSQILVNGSLAALTFNYSTQAQNLPALRTAYASATQVQAIMIGDFLSSLTDPQLQSIFSMSAGQVTALRSNKLAPATSAATTIRAAVGQ